MFRERGHDILPLVGGSPAGEQQHVDIRDSRSVSAALNGWNPTHVLHLAGASSVARSHEDPGEAFAVNTLGTVHLLDAVHRAAAKVRVVIVSSGEVYGDLDHAAHEDDPTNPTSPYAASKLAAEIAARQFHTSYGMHVVIARPFNHLGPGQASHFVVPSFARQLVEIKKAGKGELRVGNLEAVRDFSHVLDVVDAYEILLERGDGGETYNIASGEGRSIRSLLDEMIEIMGIRVDPTIDPARVRPVELPRLVGESSKVQSLGMKRSRTVREALREAIDDATRTRPGS
ncbi:MAG: GDP-mannose 4,6-dehydratase [Polyangiaceae bacterium]